MLGDKRVSKRLKHDPTRGYKEKLVTLLTGLKDQGKITLDQYRDLYPTLDLVTWLHGSQMQKIHKKGNPLHLVMDYMGSMAYTTSKAIVNLLKPLVGKTIYHIKNTAQFSQQLWDLQLKEDEIMNSHDWTTRGVKAAVKIRKSGAHAMNRDGGHHQLPSLYSTLLVKKVLPFVTNGAVCQP